MDVEDLRSAKEKFQDLLYSGLDRGLDKRDADWIVDAIEHLIDERITEALKHVTDILRINS